MKYNPLTPEEEEVIVHKATERPYTGTYLNHKEEGVYLCKRCNAPLYRSEDKFDSHCGWPSFDEEIPGAVKRIPDADGQRTEIICNRCAAHLGHVFLDEGFTAKQTRHCVNSLSLQFIPAKKSKQAKAYFAGGCFWGMEYYFMRATGVKSTTMGYMGGHVEHPTYEEVCGKKTGHFETTEVVYDPAVTSYAEMVKLFFEIHDFTQLDGQGPDIGPQYRSAIFYGDDAEKAMAERYLRLLQQKGYRVATIILPATTFWKAEAYHQQYYQQKGATPYCHKKREIF